MSEDTSTESRIFEAAVQVFEEKGLEGARMQEIADRAGINKALLHYYFRSKEKLFDAVFNKLAGIMFDRIWASFAAEGSLQEKLACFYKEHISFLEEHPRLPAFLLEEMNKNPDRVLNIMDIGRVQNVKESLFKQLDAEMKAGKIHKVDKMQLLINIIGLSIFPFAARGLLETLLNQMDIPFEKFIEKRKKELPHFVMNAVGKK